MTHHEFETLCLRIARANDPDDLFPRAGGVERRREVDEQHATLVAALERGGRLGEGAWRAAALMRARVDDLRARALEATAAEVSGYRAAAPPAAGVTEGGAVIRAARGAYRVTSALARGDLGVLYEGRCVEGEAEGEAVVVKIALDAADNDLMADEASALGVLWAAAGPQVKHLPRLLDAITTDDGRAGVVLSRVEGLDLTALRERFPRGLPAVHAIWITKRLLSALGYAHSLGVVHANVEPSHVLVRARDHNVTLIDWAYALVDPARTGRGFKAENPGFSGPEVGERRPPLPAADLFSVGRCMAFLLGAEAGGSDLPASVDDGLVRFVAHLTRPSALQRAGDAWQAHEELERLRAELLGPPAFVELDV